MSLGESPLGSISLGSSPVTDEAAASTGYYLKSVTQAVNTTQPRGVPVIDWEQPLSRGLVGAYTQPTSLINNIVNTQPVTVNNTPTVEASRYGLVTDHVPTSATQENLHDPSVSLTGDASRTVMARVLHDATQPAGATPSILSLGTNSTGTRWDLKILSGALRIEIQGSGYTSSLSVTNDEWVDLGCSFEGSTLADHRLFLNGVFENTTGGGTVNTGDDGFYIMSSNDSLSIGNRGLAGKLAHCYIWDRALSDSEIRSISDNPWQIFKPEQPLTFMNAAITPAGTIGPLAYHHYQQLMRY